MPTPIAHTLAGYTVALFAQKNASQPGQDHTVEKRERRITLLVLALSLFMANAPDLDFIPGLIIGRPGVFHAGITHSLGFALVLSAAAAGLAYRWTRSFWPVFGLLLGSYLSHLLLDYLNPDGRPPYGVPFFWPLSGQYFISPVTVFLGVHHTGSAVGTTWEFVRSVANLDNLREMVYELGVLLPFTLLGLWFQRVRRLRRLRWFRMGRERRAERDTGFEQP